jgi:hypothetical protein
MYRFRASSPTRSQTGGTAPVRTALACALLIIAAPQAAFAAPFQERLAEDCSNDNDCDAEFVVPANQRVTVTSTSCTMHATNNANPRQPNRTIQMQFEVRTAAGDLEIVESAVPIETGANAGRTFAASNDDTFFVARGGWRIRAQMATEASGTLEFECKIAGTNQPL